MMNYWVLLLVSPEVLSRDVNVTLTSKAIIAVLLRQTVTSLSDSGTLLSPVFGKVIFSLPGKPNV